MKKPILAVMAAGMGSRYGGLKQMDPVGPCGEVIMDFSLFDARRAGFETVVFIIKKEMEPLFREKIGDRVARHMEVRYAFQTLEDLPEGFSVPAGRTKPWGTCHAVMAARNVIDAPFAVINADDYYGPESFRIIYDFLSRLPQGGGDMAHYCMVGYRLENTVTEHGSVSRGVCQVRPDGTLSAITERTRIETYPGGIHFTEDGGDHWHDLAPETPVSMNLWGFDADFLAQAWARFPAQLTRILKENPEKGECYLPAAVETLLDEGKADVAVLSTPDKWYGVTYQADKEGVVAALAALTDAGRYPSPLWD